MIKIRCLQPQLAYLRPQGHGEPTNRMKDPPVLPQKVTGQVIPPELSWLCSARTFPTKIQSFRRSARNLVAITDTFIRGEAQQLLARPESTTQTSPSNLRAERPIYLKVEHHQHHIPQTSRSRIPANSHQKFFYQSVSW